MALDDLGSSSFDKLPKDVKQYLDGNPPPAEVLAKILKAFDYKSQEEIENMEIKVGTIKKRINEGLKHKDLDSMKESLALLSEKGEIEYTKGEYNVTIKIGNESMEVLFLVESIQEDGTFINGCMFSFIPNNMEISRQLDLLEKFENLLNNI